MIRRFMQLDIVSPEKSIFSGEVDSIQLIKKFGEVAVNQLIKKAELIEYKGKIRVLE